MLFISVLICACALGYLAQKTGLCMVKGVIEFKSGNKSFLLAIIFSGVLAWIPALFAHFADIPLNFKTYAISGWFLLGGIIFGVGAALNNGCGISTLGRLTHGDIKMTATIVGWLIGWIFLVHWSPTINVVADPLPGSINYFLLIITSLAITIWIFLGTQERKKLWLGMMGIGLLSGFIYLYQPQWPLSGLLNQLSTALIYDKPNTWPTVEQYLILMTLLLGMFISAWRANTFLLISSHVKHWIKSLLAGILMGIGASLAMGGNSVQLLLSLPTFSPAGFEAITGMLLGIWGGLYIQKIFTLFNRNLSKNRR